VVGLVGTVDEEDKKKVRLAKQGTLLGKVAEVPCE
jgi:hypothetical protein